MKLFGRALLQMATDKPRSQRINKPSGCPAGYDTHSLEFVLAIVDQQVDRIKVLETRQR